MRARTSHRLAASVALVALVVLAVPGAAGAAAPWKETIDRSVGGRPFSVAVGDDGAYWYRHLAGVRRPPASNQKLLLSMALLDLRSGTRRIPTEVLVGQGGDAVVDGVLRGDLWLVGHGDPEVDHADLAELADLVVAAGIHRVRGDVVGWLGAFRRDWFAPGWRDYFPDVYIPRPTALTFHENTSGGHHVAEPERWAARVFRTKLRARDVDVRGVAAARRSHPPLRSLGRVTSAPLLDILHRMNVPSSNFRAEVLGKWLGLAGGGSIDAGADRVCAWVAGQGERFTCEDASGLSYANRASARGLTRLLWRAETEPWGEDLRSTLARGGQGTLRDRLTGVRIRAKTGTLIDVSALSGWIWVEAAEDWVPFSIMSSGFDDATAKTIEDRIVRVLAHDARPPG